MNINIPLKDVLYRYSFIGDIVGDSDVQIVCNFFRGKYPFNEIECDYLLNILTTSDEFNRYLDKNIRRNMTGTLVGFYESIDGNWVIHYMNDKLYISLSKK